MGARMSGLRGGGSGPVDAAGKAGGFSGGRVRMNHPFGSRFRQIRVRLAKRRLGALSGFDGLKNLFDRVAELGPDDFVARFPAHALPVTFFRRFDSSHGCFYLLKKEAPIGEGPD
jgi:hypothetical protein